MSSAESRGMRPIESAASYSPWRVRSASRARLPARVVAVMASADQDADNRDHSDGLAGDQAAEHEGSGDGDRSQNDWSGGTTTYSGDLVPRA